MTGRHADTTTDLQVRGCEVNFLGTALADIDNTHALLTQSIDQRRLDGLGSQTNIMPDNNRAWIDNLCIPSPYTPRNILI